MFEVGQKVVCIYPGPWIDASTEERVYEPTPRLNRVYVVRGMLGFSGDSYLQLAEFHSCPGYDLPPGFAEWCFRPLEKKQTDISVFTEMLKKAPAPGRPTREAVWRYDGAWVKLLDTIRPSAGLGADLPILDLCWREWAK
jgi:hypothetical protein